MHEREISIPSNKEGQLQIYLKFTYRFCFPWSFYSPSKAFQSRCSLCFGLACLFPPWQFKWQESCVTGEIAPLSRQVLHELRLLATWKTYPLSTSILGYIGFSTRKNMVRRISENHNFILMTLIHNKDLLVQSICWVKISFFSMMFD